MRKIANRTAAWMGASISIGAMALIIAVYVQQWTRFFTPDITAILTPALLFGLPLTLTLIGFVSAGAPKLCPRMERAVVIISIVAPLGAPITLLLMPKVTPAPLVGWAELLIIAVILIFALLWKSFTDLLAARYVQFCGIIIGLVEVLILAFMVFLPFPLALFVLVPALTFGVPALIASRSQVRAPTLSPAAFMGIWCGIATLMVSAVLGFMSIGFYVWVVATILIACALVAQFAGEIAVGD